MRFNVFRGCRHVKSINLASVKAVSRCDFPDVQVNFAHLNKIMSAYFSPCVSTKCRLGHKFKP